MNEYDLFAAIGGADEELLPEQPRRITPLRRLGLIAAVLALVVLTACAAPTVIRAFNALTGGSAEMTQSPGELRSLVIDWETGDVPVEMDAQTVSDVIASVQIVEDVDAYFPESE